VIRSVVVSRQCLVLLAESDAVMNLHCQSTHRGSKRVKEWMPKRLDVVSRVEENLEALNAGKPPEGKKEIKERRRIMDEVCQTANQKAGCITKYSQVVTFLTCCRIDQPDRCKWSELKSEGVGACKGHW
jgi:hypothetical protein